MFLRGRFLFLRFLSFCLLLLPPAAPGLRGFFSPLGAPWLSLPALIRRGVLSLSLTLSLPLSLALDVQLIIDFRFG